jgi:TonB-dependent SusC/RagA subfamily outer membrane receptor
MSLINRSTRLLLAVCAISFIVAPSRAFGQGTTGTISGVVSDSSGSPVVGARVSVDGLSLATSSGQTGRYTLSNVPAGTQTVRARLLGYRLTQAQTTVIAGQTATVNLRLNIAPAELERVVVSTGYGEQTKANVTGASEVVAGEEITKRPVANITKGLQGFMPGVTVQDFGGRPGSDGATVRIRGAGTLGNNGALIIVDGVVGEINNLSALDIESVSVLKDAASAAIYGARAANGVVIIKTRRGRNTGSLKFTYDGYVAQQKAQDMPQRVDIRTELNMVNWVYTSSGQAPKYTAGLHRQHRVGHRSDQVSQHELARLIYKTAPMSDQTVRLSGGNDLATLSLSANYFDQEGILNTENYYKRATLRGNTELQLLQAAHGAGQPHADA